MKRYEAPRITELGSVADLTQQGNLALDFDGHLFKKKTSGGGGTTPPPPIS